MTQWEEDSSFELPDDESWRGEVHAPQGPYGDTVSTWQPGMTADQADDLDDEEDDVSSDLEVATEEELTAACSPLAKRISNTGYLIVYLIWMEENHIQEIKKTLRVSEKQARRLREELIAEILTSIETVCPTKTVDMDDALGLIYEEGFTIPCKKCGDQQVRYGKYCASCGIRNPDFCDELFQVFYGHSAAAEEEHRCPDVHKTAVEARATGYCSVCGLHFPPHTKTSPD
ncbi:MAG: hypothetical protein AAB351_02440 [Patescibacteria group bacterium]